MNITKRLFLSLIALCFAITAVQAQAEKGQFTIGAAVGVVPTFMADKGSTNVLPLSINVDYRISDIFSMSAFGGYTSATSQEQVLADGILVQYQNDLVMVGLRGTAHANRWDRFDLYGGFMLSYAMPTVTEIPLGENVGEPVELGPSKDKPYKYNKPTAKFLPSGFIGGAWNVNSRIGLFAEVGYSISLLNTGIQIRL